MASGHEKLDVYRLAIGYVAWVFEHSEKLNGARRHARDPWLRASQSIPLNIAEENESRERKVELDRMAAMLSRSGKRGCSVQEEPGACGIDFDSDPDSEKSIPPGAAPNAGKPRE